MKNQVFIYLIVPLFLIGSSCETKNETLISNVKILETTSLDTYNLTKNQFQSSQMVLGRMEMTSFYELVKANGKLDVPPENCAEVSSYFGGTVKEIRLLPGERVKKGQILFTLENPDYVQMQQDFLEAKGQLAYLNSDYERQKNLAQDNVTSQKNFLKAESEYTVTSVKLEALRKKLSLMNISPNTLTLENIRTTVAVLSPINGYVTEVAISKGTFLNQSKMAISIMDTDHIHLELNIFEKDISKINIGQVIHFNLQDNRSEAYKAKVHLISKTVHAENRTVGIHGHLVDGQRSNRFYPGMYVEAEIFISSLAKMSLPQDAIVEIDGKYYVLVLQNALADAYTFVKKEVKIGLTNKNQVEVLNFQDFKENAKFLINGSFNLITE
ncbi:MAG: efflux RND transporter periplasmic adaptor subunit [Saprospiraceae bacterium]|nr:efflux RND transporter periplasmic adaptor subunit [Saprospiraceae bacterium]